MKINLSNSSRISPRDRKIRIQRYRIKPRNLDNFSLQNSNFSSTKISILYLKVASPLSSGLRFSLSTPSGLCGLSSTRAMPILAKTVDPMILLPSIRSTSGPSAPHSSFRACGPSSSRSRRSTTRPCQLAPRVYTASDVDPSSISPISTGLSGPTTLFSSSSPATFTTILS